MQINTFKLKEMFIASQFVLLIVIFYFFLEKQFGNFTRCIAKYKFYNYKTAFFSYSAYARQLVSLAVLTT